MNVPLKPQAPEPCTRFENDSGELGAQGAPLGGLWLCGDQTNTPSGWRLTHHDGMRVRGGAARGGLEISATSRDCRPCKCWQECS